MDFNSEFNKESLLDIYSKNKQLALPLLAIVVSIILTLFFILPQLISFPSNKSQADQENVKLNKIQEAYDLLIGTNERIVDENLGTAQKALPDKKDFQSVLSAISLASNNSSTQILNYSYGATSANNAQEKYPTLVFTVELSGEVSEAVKFINELYKIYPVSDVISISNANNSSMVVLTFYYRAFPPITLDDRTMVSKMTAKEEEALKIISSWNNEDIFLQPPQEASSSSTTPF